MIKALKKLHADSDNFRERWKEIERGKKRKIMSVPQSLLYQKVA